MYEAEEIKILFIVIILVSLLFLFSLVVVIVLFRKNQNKIILENKIKEERHHNTILKREIEAQNRLIEEKERISLDLHDDMGSTLSAVGLQARLLKDKTKDDEIIKGLSQIIRYSGELTLSMREIMWSLNSRNDNIEQFINYVKNYIDSYFENTNIKITFDIHKIDNNISLASYKRRQLYLVIKEICHNILKHSSATRIVFLTEVKKNTLFISIQDNGIGIENIERTAGVGISNIQKRIHKLGGDVRFENFSEGLGIAISVPLKGLKHP